MNDLVTIFMSPETTGGLPQRRQEGSKAWYFHSPMTFSANVDIPNLGNEVRQKGGLIVTAHSDGRISINYSKMEAPTEAVRLTATGGAQRTDIRNGIQLASGEHLFVATDRKAEELLLSFFQAATGLTGDMRQALLLALRRPNLEARIQNLERLRLGVAEPPRDHELESNPPSRRNYMRSDAIRLGLAGVGMLLVLGILWWWPVLSPSKTHAGATNVSQKAQQDESQGADESASKNRPSEPERPPVTPYQDSHQKRLVTLAESARKGKTDYGTFMRQLPTHELTIEADGRLGPSVPTLLVLIAAAEPAWKPDYVAAQTLFAAKKLMDRSRDLRLFLLDARCRARRTADETTMSVILPGEPKNNVKLALLLGNCQADREFDAGAALDVLEARLKIALAPAVSPVAPSPAPPGAEPR
jgi:hypothetical protein